MAVAVDEVAAMAEAARGSFEVAEWVAALQSDEFLAWE